MEDSQHHSHNPESLTPTPGTPVVPVQRKTNKGLISILLAIGGVLLVACLCVGLCMALGGVSLVKVFQEKAPIEAAVDNLMRTMVQKDTDKAFTLFSARARRQMKVSDLENMIQGNNYVMFEGYQSIELSNLNVSTSFDTNPNVPQGLVAKVDGNVHYADGTTGTFDAVLEKENGVWRFDTFHITVPPNKLVPKTMLVQEQ